MRYKLSLADVSELLLERGVNVSREAIREWVGKFGPEIAIVLDKKRRKIGKHWHVDETYMKVAGVLKNVHADLNGTDPTVRDIKRGIQSRVDVERIDVVKATDFKISKEGKGYRITIKYEDKVPYIYNVSFAVDFEKSVEITR